MSEKEFQPPPTTRVETQQERWLKYGGNVALMTVVVIGIAIVMIWCFQTPQLSARVDTTKAGLYSLKPQTVNIIKNNKQPIKIVSLYTPKKQGTPGVEEDFDSRGEAQPDQVQAVTDLLDEYRRKGNKIEVEVIDPAVQQTKVDQLIEEVIRNSGAEVKKYKAVVDEYPKVYDQIAKIATEQSKQVQAALQKTDKIDDPELGQTLILTMATVQGLPPQLKRTRDGVEKRIGQKIPDYRGAVNSIDEGMQMLSGLAGRIIEDFGAAKDNAKVPAEIKNYMKDSLASYAELKKLADDFAKRIKELGELKLEDLKQSLRAKNSILVMGENEWRILPFERVWQEPDAVNAMMTDGKPRKKFAGEQQITSAILSLTNKTKPKVVFVRPSGPPVANPGIPGFQRGGPLSVIAERLREYNFEVLEKDLSGMWAMQAQMQRQFAAPEPSDEEIKDAVWIVLGIPSAPNQMGMPPQSVGPRLAAHLRAGGSAMVLTMPNGDAMADALSEWGVTVHTDVVAVHEALKPTGARSADPIEEAMRVQMIFVIRDYGDHMLTGPLKSLDSILFPILPIETQAKAGYKTTRILPVPQTLKVWGETNVEGAMNGEEMKYDAPKGAAKGGDMSPPLYGGAVVEKEGGGRLIVFGCIQFALNQIIGIPDPNLARQGILVSRFPGNSELFLNSVFWLGRQEPLISISPTAMEVSRIKEINSGVLGVWRVGVLLILLPALVIVAGVVMFVRRRD
jgi:hypothetical protein